MALNNSIFDIPDSADRLETEENVIKISTRKIIPKSSSKRDNFPGSNITFDFTLSGNQYWLPSRSFVLIKDALYVGKTTGAGANQPVQPNLTDNVAPALNCQDNLFDGCQLTIGGFSLGSRTKLAPQISAINKRVMKSSSWLTGVGKSAHTWDSRFNARKNDVSKFGIIPDSSNKHLDTMTGTVAISNVANTLVGTGTKFLSELVVGDAIKTAGGQYLIVKSITSDTAATHQSDANTVENTLAYSKVSEGYPSGRANKNQRVYVPPLGVFSSSKALPPSRYELTLRPKPDILYKQSAVSSTGATTIKGGARDTAATLINGEVEYLIDDIVLYIAVVDNKNPAPSIGKYVLDLEETEVLPRKINGGSVVQENFTVSKSTYALTVALQSKVAGRDTQFSPSRMVVKGDFQNQLDNLRVDFGGQSRPSPAANPAFIVDGNSFKDYSTWRYAETSTEDLAYYDTGGVLTKDDWRELGPIYHFQWRRTGDDISTNCDVEVGYPNAFDSGEQENLLLFHHFRRVIEMTIEAGQVTNFLAQDA